MRCLLGANPTNPRNPRPAYWLPLVTRITKRTHFCAIKVGARQFSFSNIRRFLRDRMRGQRTHLAWVEAGFSGEPEEVEATLECRGIDGPERNHITYPHDTTAIWVRHVK